MFLSLRSPVALYLDPGPMPEAEIQAASRAIGGRQHCCCLYNQITLLHSRKVFLKQPKSRLR